MIHSSTALKSQPTQDSYKQYFNVNLFVEQESEEQMLKVLNEKFKKKEKK